MWLKKKGNCKTCKVKRNGLECNVTVRKTKNDRYLEAGMVQVWVMGVGRWVVYVRGVGRWVRCWKKVDGG